jgi:hypothetical protein
LISFTCVLSKIESIDEKDFDRVQKDRLKELTKWAEQINKLKNKARFAIMAANNHYMRDLALICKFLQTNDRIE